MSGELNSGSTHSNLDSHQTLIVIGPTTSAAEFNDSLDHEKGHLTMHISIAYNIDPFGEEFEYLRGFIAKQTFKAAKELLCDYCRQSLIHKE